MLLGLLTTIFLIPNTVGSDNKPSTLETLAAEGSEVKNLMKRILNGRAGSHPHVERDAEQGRYTDNEVQQVEESSIRTSQNQHEVDRSEGVELNELDKVSLGQPALAGSPPG